MRLKSVDTTPNPNSMKLNLDGVFSTSQTYTAGIRSGDTSGCPGFVEELLAIDGVKSVFVCNDFLTLNRDPGADWRTILAKAGAILGGGSAGEESGTAGAIPDAEAIEAWRQAALKEGQVQILVQTFRGIPIQVKAVAGGKEARISLGERFNAAAQAAQAESGADFLKERYWADHGVRYGPLEEVASEVADELRGTFDQRRLEKMRDVPPSIEALNQLLKDDDWHRRLGAVQILSTIENCVTQLAIALKDSNPQVRRLAAAALGTTGSAEAIAPLCEALVGDQSVGVRRTAGDALSDIGDRAAQPAVCQALKDSNKLVRWRAARFLAEVGTEEALPFLEEAADDAEFEVRLEIEAALQRIRGGGQGLGPVWKRIIGQA
jgi:Virulence factor/HEAT repeats/Scaffold protein Nfu/NifU N terminal